MFLNYIYRIIYNKAALKPQLYTVIQNSNSSILSASFTVLMKIF